MSSSADRPDEAEPSLVFERAATRHSPAEDVLGLLTGTFAASFGLYLLNTAGAVTGGTAGLSLLLGFATGWPFAVLFAIINLPFAILAIWQKGWNFTVRTVLAIGLVSGFSALHPHMLIIASLQPWYGALAGNLLCGIGLLIVFRHRASMGGVNVVALVVQDRTGFRAGWLLMIFDVLVVAASAFVVPWANVLMSAVGAVLLNLVLALNHRPGRYIGR